MVDNYWKRKFDDLLCAIGVATYGKQMFFEQDDGTWYSRRSGTDGLSVDDVIKECKAEIEFWSE